METDNKTEEALLERQEQLKKIGVFSLMGLAFLTAMYFIFAPSGTTEEKQQEGLNPQVPQASDIKLPEDKLKGYELGQDEVQPMASLDKLYQDFEQTGQDSNNINAQAQLQTPNRQYEETQRVLASFNEEEVDYEKQALREELEELKAQLHSQEQQRLDEEEQEAKRLRMLERSYELAARYMPQGSEGTKATKEEEEVKEDPREQYVSIVTSEKSIVSSLNAEVLADSIPHNKNFLSVLNTNKRSLQANTIRACVDRTRTLANGASLRLRLLDEVSINGHIYPAHSLCTAIAHIKNNRLNLEVKTIEYKGYLQPIKLIAYDLDGVEGLFVPKLLEQEAVKDIGKGLARNMGTSFTFSSSAKEQVAAELTRSVMQGASQYLNKRLQQVKITVKAGYQLLLMAKQH